MNNNNTNPAFVVPGKSSQQLIRLPKAHSKFDESFLQELLVDHPELLPVCDIRHDAGSLLCIGREVPVASGSIDNLYLSTSGYPVIVETKLWRNPQARREVLAQTLDYIKEIVKEDYEWFEKQWRKFSQHQLGQEVNLITKLNEIAGDEIDESFIVDRLNGALLRGDVIAMIVGDGIETGLQELIAHLCKDSPNLRYSLAMVELACYKFSRSDEEGIFIVPRIIQNVEPVERAYVRVELANELQGQLNIIPVVTPDLGPKPPRLRNTLDEEDLLKSIEYTDGSSCRDSMKQFYDDLIETFHLEPDFKSAALMLKIPHPDGKAPGISLLGFTKDGFYNSYFLKFQLETKGIIWGINPDKAKQIVEEFGTAMNTIDSRFKREGIMHQATSQFIPYKEIEDKVDQIKSEIEKVVAAVRTAYDKSCEQ